VSSVSHRGFTHLGLDVSKDSISVAVLEPDRDRAAVRKIFHDESSVRRLIGGFGDRSKLWVQNRVDPMFDERGQFVGAVGTLKLREATGEVLPRHEFSLHPLQRMSSWTRAAAASGGRATVRRAKRARHRLRGGATGEFRKIDVTQTPERRIHVSETPDRVIK